MRSSSDDILDQCMPVVKGVMPARALTAISDRFTQILNLASIFRKTGFLTKSEFREISEEDVELLENVYQTFGTYSAWGLRNLTHGERPWIEATDNGRVMNREISRDSIRDYFKHNYIE